MAGLDERSLYGYCCQPCYDGQSRGTLSQAVFSGRGLLIQIAKVSKHHTPTSTSSDITRVIVLSNLGKEKQERRKERKKERKKEREKDTRVELCRLFPAY